MFLRKINPLYGALVAVFLLLLALRLLSGFNGLYGQDSHEYLRYAGRLAAFLKSGTPPGDYFWPVNYPLWSALLSLLIPSGMWAAQLISMLALLLTVAYTAGVIRLFYPRESTQEITLYLTLALLFSPLMFQGAFLIMSDMLATAMVTAAFYHTLRYRAGRQNRHFLWLLFWAASAVMTRYACAVLLLVPLLVAAITFRERFRWPILLWGLLIVVLCTLPHLLIRPGHPAAFLGHSWLQSWNLGNWFSNEFSTADGRQTYRFSNLLFYLGYFYHPAFIFFGAILLAAAGLAWWRSASLSAPAGPAILMAALLIYSLFLAGIPFQSLRFLMPGFPLVVVLLYPGFRLFHQYLRRRRGARWLLAGIIIVAQAALVHKYSAAIRHSNQLEQQIAHEMLRHPGPRLYTFWIDPALRTYGVGNPITNLWEVKLSQVETPALLLFSEEKFAGQWSGLNPMLNWQFLQQHYHLDPLQRFSDGWQLFRITNMLPTASAGQGESP